MRSLLTLISPPTKVLLLCLLLLTLNSLLNLLNPILAGQVTALLTGTGNAFFQSFMALAMAWSGLLIIRSILSFATSYKTGAVAEEVLADLRCRLYQHLQLLPLSYYDDRKRGDILSIMTNDAAAISNFVTGTLIQILPSLLTFFGAAFMVWWINWKLGLITLAFLPFYFFAMKLVGRKVRPLSREWVDVYGQMVSHAEEGISMLPAIKSFTREAEDTRVFSRKNHHLLGLSKRQLKISSFLPTITSLLAGFGLLVLISVGYSEISKGEIDPADLVSLLFFAILMNQPLSQLANTYGQMQRTRGASERIIEFFKQEREPADETNLPIDIKAGKIDFDNVRFAYNQNQKMLFEHLNLYIEAGETIAVVGENGAGKSTLVHLLMRLIEPSQGEIRIDGQPIRMCDLQSLRSQIGLVAQFTLLLNGSVAENIGWGKALASREEIERAAVAAGAHDFILKLPDGYETIIGDQGLKLSGGQRQKVSLARALLKDPPILILDEATSMLDPTSENEFLRDCRELFDQRTVILITHRPASLSIADRILLLNDGQLVEVGDVNHYLKTGKIIDPEK